MCWATSPTLSSTSVFSSFVRSAASSAQNSSSAATIRRRISVVTLERLAGEAADLLVNGSAIARGEVVVIDEQYGLRITEILDGQPDMELAEPAAGASKAPVQDASAPAAEDAAAKDAEQPPAAEG